VFKLKDVNSTNTIYMNSTITYKNSFEHSFEAIIFEEKVEGIKTPFKHKD